MNDHEARIAGGQRVSARHIEAPIGRGWDPIERCDWEAVTAVLPAPWPPGAQRQDLRYWASRERIRAGNRPSYRELAARWGVSEKAARLVCADVDWWADPRFGDERPERAEQRGRSGADEGQTKGRPRADEGQVRGATTHDANVILGDKRAGQGQARGRPGADEGQVRGKPGAPIKDRDSNRDTDSDSHREHTPGAVAPSPAGAGQLALLGGEGKSSKPSKAAREVEAAEALLSTLDAMRLERHRGGRPLKAATWLPQVRRALKRQTPQEVIDGWTWMLRSPEAAWHRGEDGRGGVDRTRDLSALLAHPEYAERRSWRGLEAAHGHDIEPRGEVTPTQTMTPLMVERERRERVEEEERQRMLAERWAREPEPVDEWTPPPKPAPPTGPSPIEVTRSKIADLRPRLAQWDAELEAAQAEHAAALEAQAAERRATGRPFGPTSALVGAAVTRRQTAQREREAVAVALMHLEAHLQALGAA